MLRPGKTAPRPTIPCLDANLCLAKTWQSGGQIKPGRNVEQHCRIAGAIARELLGGYFSFLAPCLPDNAWLCAQFHDLGKASPTFQKKIYGALSACPPGLQDVQSELEKVFGGHSAISYASLYELYKDRRLANVAGYHHARNFAVHSDSFSDYGGVEWAKMRQKLAKELQNGHSIPAIGAFWQQHLLTGLTVLADWLASGEIFDDPDQDWRPLVGEAIAKAGLTKPQVNKNLEFSQIFNFEPNEMQMVFSRAINGAGIYVLEAPMGMGKTEAALYGAYLLLASGNASGIYFGLPTQLTSNMIYRRVDSFLSKILAGRHGLSLLHSSSWLAHFKDANLGKGVESGAAWFDGNKRGILAPFAVGTIDQALMSVMRVRHSGLRALGLAGKVVIIDEAHSYDKYTGALLDKMVGSLMDCGSTVVILSATLTKSRIGEILNCKAPSADAYPLITAKSGDAEPVPIVVGREASRKVALKLLADDSLSFEEALSRASCGQQVLWIENTVGMALETYRYLGARASAMNVPCGVLHSRFTPGDREKNESLWTGIYGKSSPERCAGGHILIGTQVLEQSLDIDADFLVTRICPTDMLFQRIGRLWRHERKDRNQNARREAWILAPNLEDVLADPVLSLAGSGTSRVYAPYVLGRSVEVWHGRQEISLPRDIRPMLESTYEYRASEPTASMKKALEDMEALSRRKTGQALLSVSNEGRILDDSAPSTRLMEEESVKLLLLRACNASGACILADGSSCALEPSTGGRKGSMKIAASLVASCLNVPFSQAPEKCPPKILSSFAPYIYEARTWSDGSGKMLGGTLRIAIINSDGSLSDIFGNRLDGFHYSPHLGYWLGK